MRNIIAVLVLIVLALGLGACSGGNAEEAADKESTAEEPAAVEEEAEAPESSSSPGKETLVVYFSATGNTRGVAEKIAAVTGADIYEIKPAQEYTAEDLDWNDDNSRSSLEHNDASARPEIGSDPVSLEGYKTIYIGYPIWWGEAPRIMETFVESYDFTGITMIPFCTSGGSGIGSSDKKLAELAGSGKWLEGERLESSISEDELKAWIE